MQLATVEFKNFRAFEKFQIELHPIEVDLHPIQFVATTHSPQVVGSARREWVWLLDTSGRVAPVGFVEGRDSNGILEDVFGVPDRPEATRSALTQLFEAIDGSAHASARSQLAGLESHLGPDDPDLVRARWLLDQEDPAS